jgi:amphi-Trp domain-containing protein
MADVKLEHKEALSREQVAQQLSALADALAHGGEVELQLGGVEVSFRVPEQVRSELEVEVDGDEVELELELKWSTRTKRAAKGDSGAVPAQHAARR